MSLTRFLLRLILVPVSLVLALLVGAGVAAFAFFRATIPGFSWADLPFAGEAFLFTAVPLVVVIGPFFFGAALAAALLAEALSIRSWIFYTLAGSLIAVGLCRLFGFTDPSGYAADETAVAAGLAAGLTYWLFAGRSAGAPPAVP